MKVVRISAIFLLLFGGLFLFSCLIRGNCILPTEDSGKKELLIDEWLEADALTEINEIDTNAEIKIVSQIPFYAFNVFSQDDLIDIKIRQTRARTISHEAPREFFFNSILVANQISDFARRNPASTRGIFGDLLGITHVANGTQRVIFGILPRTARISDFRFESDVGDARQILTHLLWQYNSRFEVSFPGGNPNKIRLVRRPEITDGICAFSYKTLSSAKEVFGFAREERASMLLFDIEDLTYVRSNLRDFRISEWDTVRVSAFVNPFLAPELKNDLAALLKNTEIYKSLNYKLSVFEHGENETPKTLTQEFAAIPETTAASPFDEESSDGAQESENIEERNVLIVIYDPDNPIASQTAALMGQYIHRRTQRKVELVPDRGQKRQFFFDYDISISAKSDLIDSVYLNRRFFGAAISEESIRNLNLRIDLFNLRTFLLSPYNLVAGDGQNALSHLKVVR